MTFSCVERIESFMKYAFIFDSDIPSGEDFFCQLGFGNELNYVAGVSPVEAAIPLAQKLAAQGYTAMGFCGSFDEELIGKIQEAVGDGVTLSSMKFLPEQMEMLNAMESFQEYGVLIQAEGLTGNARFLLSNDRCNTKVCFTPNWEMAKEGVKELVDEGIYFIECCGWFKEPMIRELIEIAGGNIPIGGTGLEI